MPILVNTFLLVDVRPLMVYLTDQSIILDKQGRTIVPVVWHGQLIGFVQTQNRSQNGYLGLDYELNDKTQLFADFLIGANQIENNTRSPIWTSLAATSGYFLNQDSGNYEIWNRRFAPEELGGGRTNK